MPAKGSPGADGTTAGRHVVRAVPPSEQGPPALRVTGRRVAQWTRQEVVVMTEIEARTLVGRRQWPTIVLELLIALMAVYGGVGLAWDLVGDNAIGMPPVWLEGTPFTSWVLPGLFLLAVVAVPMGTAAVLELRRSPWAGAASVLAGAAQVGWITAQLAVMQRYYFLQPVLLGAGLAVLALALWAARHRPLVPPEAGR